jgi:asparagine synthase (glutamine-hydrolysing)
MEWLPNDLLVKVDRCLMAHGIEGRTPFPPFLDLLVSDFAFRLPDEMKATTGMTKRLLRLALNENPGGGTLRPQEQLQPTGRRVDGARQSLLETLVPLQARIREIFRREDILRAVSNPLKHHQAAWSMVFYALWHSHHVLGISVQGTIEDVLGDKRARVDPDDVGHGRKRLAPRRLRMCQDRADGQHYRWVWHERQLVHGL